MTRVGILVSLFLCFLFICFWPSVVPNQRQLSIVVSDWESYLGIFFSHLMLRLIIYFLFICFWPSVVPNQRQLSIVVSDWESYLCSLFSHLCFGVFSFCSVSAPDRTVSVFHFVRVFFEK